uniref:NADH dehydrogenase [ubiquinone] 1 alpha subcomplex assembly factor 4 n=1 Tax=Amblyomma aureolatum TaxID=187763 RepID=A0A1E1X4F4_9ACAR
MGNRLAYFASKPVRDFNIENRAQKVISAAKPKPAPRHQSDAKHETEMGLADASKVVEKREDLLERLRSIKVVSSDPKAQVQGTAPPAKSERPLPQSRTTPEEHKYGFFEPSVVPRGKLTLRQATQLLADARNDPAQFTPQALAAQYSLSEQDVHNMLKYFGVFNMYEPSADTARSQDFLLIEDMKADLMPWRYGKAAKEGVESVEKKDALLEGDKKSLPEGDKKSAVQDERTLDGTKGQT